MGGGAWPFLVGGAICLVNSDNKRDSSLLNSSDILFLTVLIALNEIVSSIQVYHIVVVRQVFANVI